MKEKARRDFAAAHPEAVPVFIWPALIALFEEHDGPANNARRANRARGLMGAALGFSSLLITAVVPVAAAENGTLAWWLGLAAIILAVLGSAIGYSGVLFGRTKWRWLSHRFFTERCRQLHFQFIINHLELAARVIDKAPGAKSSWNRLRAKTIREFKQHMTRRQPLLMQRMRDDVTEDRPWLQESWDIATAVPPDSSGLGILFVLLIQQRFEVQIDYTEGKLPKGFASPRTQLKWLRGLLEGFTVTTLALAITLGIVLMAGAMPAEAAVRILVAISGGLTAGLMTLRMLEEGIQLRAEAERYEWYLAAVKLLEARFKTAATPGKVTSLRDMERLSYQELRRFTDSFANARFVM